jgi:hypothetical protein
LAARREGVTVAAEKDSMDFNTFIGKAWHDHATDPAAVAQRLGEGLALVADEPQLARLADLVHHVHGEHLGDWRAGIAFIEGLAALPCFGADGASGQASARCLASLRLSAGQADALDTLGASDRIRAGAMAAANLAGHDTARADRLLRDALDLAQRAELAAGDPAHRTLAVTGNSLAVAIEDKPGRSAAERALMILAAQTARRHWAIAGTWLETERAEYRLAMTWLRAGDLPQARAHAQACLDIVAAHDGPALERFFGREALGQVERAAGDVAARARALQCAREAFALLDEGDRAWCAPSLDRLAA